MTAEFPAEFEQRVKDELNPVDVDRLYDDMLDDCYDFSAVGGPFAHMQASKVLAENDPVAYRCGKNDYFDSLSDEYYEIDGELYEVREVDNLKDEWDAEQEDEADEDEDDDDTDEDDE